MANLRGHDLNLVNNLKKIKKVELDNRTDKRTALKIIRDHTKLNPDVCPFREFGHLDCGGLDRYGLHKYGNKNHPTAFGCRPSGPCIFTLKITFRI